MTEVLEDSWNACGHFSTLDFGGHFSNRIVELPPYRLVLSRYSPLIAGVGTCICGQVLSPWLVWCFLLQACLLCLLGLPPLPRWPWLHHVASISQFLWLGCLCCRLFHCTGEPFFFTETALAWCVLTVWLALPRGHWRAWARGENRHLQPWRDFHPDRWCRFMTDGNGPSGKYDVNKDSEELLWRSLPGSRAWHFTASFVKCLLIYIGWKALYHQNRFRLVIRVACFIMFYLSVYVVCMYVCISTFLYIFKAIFLEAVSGINSGEWCLENCYGCPSPKACGKNGDMMSFGKLGTV